ncbi:MAG TPA: hypothetical protein DCW72_09780 [Elusimicrobia bacterium]|nr:MAG: hypothetical protein A2X29_07255 [Elusimicrobia bacterium GWA2_64_40]HAN04379.1 hypothetical protein [Elusimicrobiota bacterium]HAU90478.1 hypothetical protein [Elusimicrobiota bacterium]
MRFIALSVLLLAAPAAAQNRTEKRLTGLEKRVTGVEKRVTRLEGGSAAAGPRAEARQEVPSDPVGVAFLAKKQLVGQEKIGIRLYLEFENLSNRRLYAFNGTLLFRDEKGALIWSKPYGHSEPLGAGEKVEVSMGILSDQAREYLKFVKAKQVTVTLVKQEVYGVE